MSDENENEEMIDETAGAEETVDTNDGRILTDKEFDGNSNKAGFSFVEKSWKSVSAAINDIGEDSLLDLANVAASQAQRQKASNSLPTFDDDADGQKREEAYGKLREAGETVLSSEQDALAWKPGARELGLTTATARFAKAMSALKAAKVSGDVDLFAEKQKEAVEAKRIKDEAEARFSAGADDLLGMEL
jgi:hypothetical protein|tara:strand:+ start:416 stop:985 length:570 start_codon:yes stop_codon:yes gene_type:complete